MFGSSLRLAWRNLGRNRRRTALALGAIALAQTAVLTMDGMMNGMGDSILDSLTGPMMGHVQVHAPDWREERAPDLVIEHVEETLSAVRGFEGVAQAHARIYAPALVARDVDGHAAMIVGVDVAREVEPGGLLDGLPEEGRPGPRRALVGSALAREAGISVGDELAIFGGAADGSIANDLVTVTGILRTPLDQINRMGVIVPLASAQEIFVMPDQAHEITIRSTGPPDAAPAFAERLSGLPAVASQEVLPWQELAPEFAQLLGIFGFYGLAVLFIVFIAAAAGVANTMLMATFERRRELGMLLALGTTPGRLVRILLTEAVILGLLGVTIGSLMGAGIVHYWGEVGLDPTNLGGAEGSRADIAMYGLSFSGAMYPYLRTFDYVPGFLGVLVVSILAALGPAIATARLEPVQAMRGMEQRRRRLAPRAGWNLDWAVRSVAARYALRSLTRNFRRTMLSVLGVGFGVGVGILAISMVQGMERMTVDSAAAGGVGHLRVAPAGWNESRDISLRLQGGVARLEAIRGTKGVRVASPRARVGGLLGLGTRSTFVQLTGVDPGTEQQTLRYVRDPAEGRYLREGEAGAVVLGRAHVRRLRAELDDELVVTAVDDAGEMRSRLLVLVGIVETGSSAVDATVAHVTLEETQALSGRDGVGEITIQLEDSSQLGAVESALAGFVEGSDELLSWHDVSPELSQNLQSKSSFYRLAVFIILFVVLLGVASAQLTSVLERRKEFAVLAAVGMRGASLVRVVITEGLFLGVVAGLAALAWAAPLTYRIASTGIDMSSLMQSNERVALGGVLFDLVFHPGFGIWILPAAFGLSTLATVVASLYPAWFASRTDPASALRLDQ